MKVDKKESARLELQLREVNEKNFGEITQLKSDRSQKEYSWNGLQLLFKNKITN